jgi:hypothetical protein
LLKTQLAADEESVPTAVYIHNALNEQAWKEILAYEEFHKEYDAMIFRPVFGAFVCRHGSAVQWSFPRLYRYCFGSAQSERVFFARGGRLHRLACWSEL